MNRILRLFFCVSLLATPILGAGTATVVAETDTSEETVVSTIPTMATEPAASQPDDSATIPEKEPEPSKDKLEDVPEPEATNESEEEEEKPDKQPTTEDASPYATTLIEGVDIDADFAQNLRTNSYHTFVGWSGLGKGQDQLTDTDMEALDNIRISYAGLTSLKGIEYAINLKILECDRNNLTTLDLSNLPLLTTLKCRNNKLGSLDLSNNTELVYLDCQENSLTSLDMSSKTNLETLACSENSLTILDVSNTPNLVDVNCSRNKLLTLDMSNKPKLNQLSCYTNQLTSLDVSGTPLLTQLYCSGNKLLTLNVSTSVALVRFECQRNNIGTLDLTNNSLLKYLNCGGNPLGTLDISNNPELIELSCEVCSLSTLDVSNNLKLENLTCGANFLTDLDVSDLTSLRRIECSGNQLTTIDTSANSLLDFFSCSSNSIANVNVTNNPLLSYLYLDGNQLTDIDISNNMSLIHLRISNNKLTNLDFLSPVNNSALQYLGCSQNQISDIAGAVGLTNLTDFYANSQSLEVDIPTIIGGNATVDLLKTNSSSGLSVTNRSLTGSPVLTPNGDKIELSNVTFDNLSDKEINFEYNPGDLSEAAPSGNKQFSGKITFSSASILTTDLTPKIKKVESGGLVSWKWRVWNEAPIKAENIHATLTLPAGLVIDPSSIKRNGVPGPLSDINGTTNLGDLDQGEMITFEFNTTASGNANDWLKATGRLDWEDSKARINQTDGSVQIKDDEQTYTPKGQEDMALLSVPESFRFGFWDVKNTAQTFSLHSSNYLTNTEVVSEGFYTRLRDDRVLNSGWKLSAQLSDFKDSTSEIMPNSAGTSLRMQNLSIESIVDRDTPAEAIDPTPTGVPSTVLTDETLVAGQTAKPLVTAGTGEGTETWQLRIPFDKVSLQLPANAGKKNTYYSATLTWSLDDTP